MDSFFGSMDLLQYQCIFYSHSSNIHMEKGEIMDRKLNGKRFIVKEGMEEEYNFFLKCIGAKRIGNEKEVKEFIDPMMVLLITGGVVWAITRTKAKELESYIKFIE